MNKYDIRKAEEEWQDAEAMAKSYEEDGDKRAAEYRAKADSLKKDLEALKAKWEKQKSKSRESSRGRAAAYASVGMKRTRYGGWESREPTQQMVVEGLREIFAAERGVPIQEQIDDDPGEEQEPLEVDVENVYGWNKLLTALEEAEEYTFRAKQAWRTRDYREILARSEDALESIAKIAEPGVRLTGRNAATSVTNRASSEFASLRRMLK